MSEDDTCDGIASARRAQLYRDSVSLLQADQEMETNAFADLEDYTDLTAAATAADEAGPSSLPLKENMQPATGRISANTRGQQPRPGLLDTRTIAEPSLKGQSGGCDPGSRLRSAAPKDGTEPASFYGSGRLASMQQAAPESTTGPQRRPSSRVQKRKAEQVLFQLLPHSTLPHVTVSCLRGSASLNPPGYLCAGHWEKQGSNCCAEQRAHHPGRLR